MRIFYVKISQRTLVALFLPLGIYLFWIFPTHGIIYDVAFCVAGVKLPSCFFCL